jgi:signal transduction histidine kinase
MAVSVTPPAAPARRLRALLPLVAVGLLYYVSGRLGIALAYHDQDASLVWPAVGVAVAGMLLFGYGAAPAIFLASTFAAVHSGAHPVPASIVAVGNTLGPVLAVWLLRRIDFRPTLARARDTVSLFLIGGLPAALISATVGVATLTLRGRYEAGTELTHWIVWVAGDLAGLVIAAPFLLVWSVRPSWTGSRGRSLEFALLVAAAALACFLAFGVTAREASVYPLAYVVFPFAAWAALRFEQHGAATLSALIITIAVWQTLLGGGPFSGATLQQTLMHLHAFVVVVGASTLVLAAVTSERRRLARAQQEALRSERNARMEAQKAVAAREKVLAVVSHEVRNPLATVLLNSSLVLDSAPAEATPPWMREALESVVLAAEQIEHVIRDLTEVTRLEAGQLSMERSVQPAAELVQHVLRLFGPLVEAKGLRLESALDPDLPPLLVNRERVLQVFSNLIGNAVRLTPPGGSLRIESRRLTASVRFSVLDTGPGIPAAQASDLSLPYWDSPLRVNSGQGLGIPIARAIVSAHGGDFRIVSRPEGGARVDFTLPCVEPAVAPHVDGSPARAAKAAAPGTTAVV